MCRLMIEFSGTNRSYCYVRYTKPEEAREAIRKLHNFPIRPGCCLAITRSVDNRKLCLKLSGSLEVDPAKVGTDCLNFRYNDVHFRWRMN